MENTNCGEKCCYVKNGFCESDEQCPNYLESFWKTDKETKLVKDCSPKRMLMEQQSAITRMIGVQGALEQVRNRLDKLESMLNSLAHESKVYLDEQKKLEDLS